MSNRVASLVRELDRGKTEYGGGAGGRKVRLLRGVEKGRLPKAEDLLRLHEGLCFLRAYPDVAELLGLVNGGSPSAVS